MKFNANQLEEKDRYIETLKKELEKASLPHNSTKKATYNNYFLQVQTLINQKAIEAPGEKGSLGNLHGLLSESS